MRESPIKSFLLFSSSLIISTFIRILGFTWQIYYAGDKKTLIRSRPGFFTFWHEHIIALSYTHRKLGIGTLISTSRDGELTAGVMRMLGFTVMRGDSEAQKIAGAIELIKYGKKGNKIAITPDGPTGPRRKAKPGFLRISSLTELPLYAVSVKTSRYFSFSSWDKQRLPLPFSRITVEIKPVIKKSTESIQRKMD